MNNAKVIAKMVNARVWMDENTAKGIAAFCAKENIPFCEECVDFHHADEDHSDLS
jgi:roadblock/LC7 domain-containing protein